MSRIPAKNLLDSNVALFAALNDADKKLIEARDMFYAASDAVKYLEASEALLTIRKALIKFDTVSRYAVTI